MQVRLKLVQRNKTLNDLLSNSWHVDGTGSQAEIYGADYFLDFYQALDCWYSTSAL